MRRFSVCFCWVISFFCFFYTLRVESKRAASPAALSEVSADVMYRQSYEVKSADVKQHFESLAKTRQLNEIEKNLQKLVSVANLLKVEKFISYNKDPGQLEPQNVSEAMVKKMHEHPKWDVALNSQIPHLDLLKNNFGESSYGWAWFLNQRGEKAQAKKILLEVYEDGFKNIMKMQMLHFDGTSPLTEMEYVQKALGPMTDANEKVLIDTKMQTMKRHFSNLPNSNILT